MSGHIAISSKQLYDSLPIPPDSHAIRLLDLDAVPARQKDRDQVDIQLVGRVRVAHLHSSLSFAALSYVWGETTSLSRTITCLSPRLSAPCSLRITANCYHALRQIQEQSGPVTVWVDSICINQEDNNEKANQIPLMREIYGLAQLTYIWLGNGSSQSDRAMVYLQQRAKRERRIPITLLTASEKEMQLHERRTYHKMAWNDFIRKPQIPII